MTAKYSRRRNQVTTEAGTVIDLATADKVWLKWFKSSGIAALNATGGIYMSEGMTIYPDGSVEDEDSSQMEEEDFRLARCDDD